MKVQDLLQILGADFYTGVPDSQLKALCDALMDIYGIDPAHHMIAANEGNCVALAAGYHLATGRVPVVYMQNSGEGNIINPVASLCNDRVYGIPMIFVIGWRGEPGVKDEPQHIFQGEITTKLLEVMDIPYAVISQDTSVEELQAKRQEFEPLLAAGKNVAFIVRKGALTDASKVTYENENVMLREEIIRHVVKAAGDDLIVSTTGKASRELFEIREAAGEDHGHDFLTVGSMGHASSIALGVALQTPHSTVWCLDGDGAALMHMGAMAVIGTNRPKNMIHVIINNGAHETVGGMPTVAKDVDLVAIAKGCGYPYAICVSDFDALDVALEKAKKCGELSLIEVKASIGARADLGRPTTQAKENKEAFMAQIRA